jgi:hypothetical protein
VCFGGGGGQWGEMNQSLYAHMNNKRKMKKIIIKKIKPEGKNSSVQNYHIKKKKLHGACHTSYARSR